MPVRHKIPTIFNIYMVDVLCCALGCVVLLWQVSYQDATDRGDALETSLNDLKGAQLSLRSLHSEIDNLKVSLDSTQKKEVQVTLALDDTRKALDAAEKLALVRKKDYDVLRETHDFAQAAFEKLRSQFKDLESRSKLTGTELTEKIKANVALAEKLGELEKAVQVLGKDNLETLAKLKTANLRVRLLEDNLGRSQTEATESRKKVDALLKDKDAMNLRMTVSSKDIETLQAALAKLSAENLETIRKARLVQAAAQNRFAGITLTGRKVVFMVDMSGSMELTDENTADPDKWPLVCDTVARILESLLDVTHYQVILFSDKVRYPLGNEGRWIEVRDRDQDAKAIATQLKTMRPQGPTNMYAAFDEAFKLRPQGLDTIYVFSDGLPNDGPGLPTASGKLNESAITAALSKHLRGKLKDDWNAKRPNTSRVRINTIGFFYESPELGAFLWALSRENDGSFVGLR